MKDLDRSQEGSIGWQEILADAFVHFFLEPPKNAAEAARRFLVVVALVFLSGGSYVLVKDPSLVYTLAGRPIIEQTIEQRMNRKMQEEIERKLEEWFYLHRPQGLMFVAWNDLFTLEPVWVRPTDKLRAELGVRDIGANIRAWAGPFMFGECVYGSYANMPGMMIAACPIYTEFDVYGYVAAVFDPSEVKVSYVQAEVRNLAREVTRILYP